MLKLNREKLSLGLVKHNLNTSHVKVKRSTQLKINNKNQYLNKSHVKVKRSIQEIELYAKRNLNTSHVKVKHARYD